VIHRHAGNAQAHQLVPSNSHWEFILKNRSWTSGTFESVDLSALTS
jgi:hypothetical protein